MESRWYLFAGQTLENTKISEREHALHITKSAWGNITRHLDRKKILQEAAEKEAAVKKYLDEGSKNMTKSWENSLENVRRRKEEERLRLIEEKKAERDQKFVRMMKEQERTRKEYMDKVKTQKFMSTGNARDLTSAVVTSEALFERENQRKFQNKLKQLEKEEDQKFAEKIRKDAELEAIEKEEEKRKKIEKERKNGEELKKMIVERQEFQKRMRDERVKNEALDNLEAIKEITKLEEMALKEKLDKKKEQAEIKKGFLKQKKELEQQKIKEEKELDEVIEIYRDVKHQIDCMRKLREKELRDEAVKRREKIAALVMAEQLDRSEAEERAIKKAMAERDAAELEKIKARVELDEAIKQERLQNRKEALEREKVKKQREEDLKKWELLNRYKTDDNTKIYEEEKKKKIWNDILKYREDLCEQMEEVKLEQLREKAIEEAFAKESLEEEDNRFFEYAEEALEQAKSKGRSTVPIEKVVTRYVKENNITSEKYGSSNNSQCSNKAAELKKKLVKPPKPKKCRCYCNKQ